jgi:hypothetical protein
MRATALIAIALLSLPVHAAKVSTFNQDCVESESIIASVQPQSTPVQQAALETPFGNTGPGCPRGQLSEEDLSHIKSVQPSDITPLVPLIITGMSAHRAQLSQEDISLIESVQPVGALRVRDFGLN